MAVAPRRQTSAFVSTGLSSATVALNVAGAATDAVPIAKQILNSAAHISAAFEKIQKKREAMYSLVETADIYAKQIDFAVANCVVDASLQRRLERLFAVFAKIEVLVNDNVGGKRQPFKQVWRAVVTKPNRAEALVVELDREIRLFQIITGIHLSADIKYDGQFRRLRDCDIEKLQTIYQRETDDGAVVWASARVDGQLMVIRYLDARSNAAAVSTVSRQLWAPYYEYLENVKKVSTVHGSHPHIVQLYGRRVQGPEAVFRSGILPLDSYLRTMHAREGTTEDAAKMRLTLMYKILVYYQSGCAWKYVLGLKWIGTDAIVNEDGEPHIGLFDDIIKINSDRPLTISWAIYYHLLCSFDFRWSEETDVIRDSALHAIISEQLRNRHNTDCLHQVWDIIRQQHLHVSHTRSVFPVIPGNLPLPQETISRAQQYLEKSMNEKWVGSLEYFCRYALAGGADVSSRVTDISFHRSLGDECRIHSVTCTCDDRQIRCEWFTIDIPTACSLTAEIARAVELPEDFETSWSGRGVDIYKVDGTEIGNMDENGEGGWVSQIAERLESAEEDSEGEDDAYETAEEGKPGESENEEE